LWLDSPTRRLESVIADRGTSAVQFEADRDSRPQTGASRIIGAWSAGACLAPPRVEGRVGTRAPAAGAPRRPPCATMPILESETTSELVGINSFEHGGEHGPGERVVVAHPHPDGVSSDGFRSSGAHVGSLRTGRLTGCLRHRQTVMTRAGSKAGPCRETSHDVASRSSRVRSRFQEVRSDHLPRPQRQCGFLPAPRGPRTRAGPVRNVAENLLRREHRKLRVHRRGRCGRPFMGGGCRLGGSA